MISCDAKRRHNAHGKGETDLCELSRNLPSLTPMRQFQLRHNPCRPQIFGL